MPDVDPKVRRRTRLYELGAYLLIVAMSFFLFEDIADQQDVIESQQTEIEDQQQRQNKTIQCTVTFLAETAFALSSRTGANTDLRVADTLQNKAWRNYVRYSLRHADPNITEEEEAAQFEKEIMLVRDYFDLFNAFLKANDEVDTTTKLVPYPKEKAFLNCIDGKKEDTQ